MVCACKADPGSGRLVAISAALLTQPEHCIVQRKRTIPNGSVRVAENQDRKTPLNTPAQKAGARYETRVEKYLLRVAKYYGCVLHSHVWFTVGNRSAQTDFFLTFPSGAAILFEVKQTWVDTSNQLVFYKHILTEIGLTPITCCTICKNLTAQTPRADIIHSFEDIKEGAVWALRI